MSARTTTQRRKGLDDYVKELFSEVPVTLRALRIRIDWQGEPIEGVQFTPSIAEDQAGRLRDLLDLTGEKLPVIFPTAGFFPRVGGQYQCLVRFKASRSGKGGVVLAFPVDRRKLRTSHQWRPGLYVHAGKMTFQHLPGGEVWMSRHPETGQVVLTWGHVKMENPRKVTITNPRTKKVEDVEVCDVDMSPYVLRPAHTSGHWVAGHPRELEGLDEGALARYDEAYADEQKRRDRAFKQGAPAPEFEMLGLWRNPFDIYDAPRSAGNPEQLVENIATWIHNADRWRRQGLVPAVHEDRFPKGWQPEDDMPPAEQAKAQQYRTLAQEIAQQARDSADAAYEWCEGLALYFERKLAGLKATGLPPSKRDFTLPKPRRGRGRRIPLISYSLVSKGQVGNPTLTQVFHTLVRHNGKWPERKAGPTTNPKAAEAVPTTTTPSASPPAKPTKRQRQAAVATPHIKPRTRTAATTGDEAMHTVGDHMPEILKTKADAKPAKPTKKQKAARKKRTLPCNECGQRHLSPEGFEGNVLEQCPPKTGKKKG